MLGFTRINFRINPPKSNQQLYLQIISVLSSLVSFIYTNVVYSYLYGTPEKGVRGFLVPMKGVFLPVVPEWQVIPGRSPITSVMAWCLFKNSACENKSDFVHEG